jgi:tetratricopeptide (TPR) repeat protein
MADDTILQEAIGAIRKGEKTRARDLLTRLLKNDPANPDCWLWMSAVVETAKERTYCLQEVLKRDPTNESARRGLVLLGVLPPDTLHAPASGNIHRDWMASFTDPILQPKPAGTGRTIPFMAAMTGSLVILLVLVVLIFSLPGRRSNTPATPPRPANTLKPTATLLPTSSPVVRTATPTFVGPTPLWMLLPATYTPTPVYVNTPHPRSEAYKAGMRAYLRSDWPAMVSFMQQLVYQETDAVDAYYHIGEAFRLQGQDNKALEAYNQAIQLNPNFAPAFLGRARARLVSDTSFDIRPDLERAVALDPNLGEAHLELAILNLTQLRVDEALQSLAAAVELLPESPLVYLYRAQAYLLQGEPGLALEDALQANQLDQTLLDGYLTLGQAYQANDQAVLSRQPLRVYLIYRPEEAEAWVYFGHACLADGDVEAALDAFTQAITLDDTLVEAYLRRAHVYLDQEDPAGWSTALEDFSEANRLEPDSFFASLGKGEALLKLGNPGDAYNQISHTASLAQSDEELGALYYWRAVALEALDRLSEARQDWQALLDLPRESVLDTWWAEAQYRFEPTATVTPTVTDTPTVTQTPAVTETRRPTRTITPASSPAAPNQTPTPGPTKTVNGGAVTPSPTR